MDALYHSCDCEEKVVSAQYDTSRFAHLHSTHTMKDSTGVCKCLFDIFCRECVWDAVSSVGYHPYFLRNVRGCMCSTGPFKFRWSRRYIHNSSYYHHQLFPLLSYVSVVVCLRCICLFERCTTSLASLYIHIWRCWFLKCLPDTFCRVSV